MWHHRDCRFLQNSHPLCVNVSSSVLKDVKVLRCKYSEHRAGEAWSHDHHVWPHHGTTSWDHYLLLTNLSSVLFSKMLRIFSVTMISEDINEPFPCQICTSTPTEYICTYIWVWLYICSPRFVILFKMTHLWWTMCLCHALLFVLYVYQANVAPAVITHDLLILFHSGALIHLLSPT